MAEFFHLLLLNLPDTIYLLDIPSGKVEFLNSNQFLGYSVAELESTNSILNAIHPKDYELVLANWQQVTSSGLSSTQKPIEYRVKSKAGNWEWIQSRITNVKRDQQGKPTQILVALTIITEQKKNEEELKENWERLEVAQRVAHVGSWEYSVKTDEAIWSKEMFRIFDLNLEEKAPNIAEYAKLIHPQDLCKLRELMAGFIAEGRKDQTLSFDYRIIRPDGTIRYLHSERMVQDVDENEKAKRIVGIEQDITEKKKAEDALKVSKEKLQNILNAMDDGVSLVGLDGKVLDCNEASLKLLGLTREEFIGTNVYDVIVPEDRQLAIDGASKVLETGKVLNQVGVLRKNNSSFCAEISVTAFYDENQKPVMFVGVTRDVTDRKKLEVEIKESEQLYRTLFDNSEDAFMLIEPIFDESGKAYDFRFLKLNSAYQRQTGAKPDDVLGKRASEITPDLELDITILSGDVLKKAIPIHREAFNKYLNRWYDSYYFPYAIDQVGILFRDITERKRAEESLFESEEKYKELVDKLPEMVFEIDMKGCIIFANLRAVELMGYSKDELEHGFDANRLVVAEDAQRSLENMKEMFSTGLRQSNEYFFVKKDGTHFPVLLISVPIVKDNKILGARGIGVDITERKQAQQALTESEERYRQLFSSMTEMVFVAELVHNENGEVEDFIYYDSNPAFLRSMGKAKDQVINKKASELLGKVEDYWLSEFSKIEKTGQAVHREEKSELTGHYYDVYAWMANSKQVGVIFEDITKRITLERQLQDNERLAAIGQTAGMVGHDIRNPLQAIVSELFLARQVMTEATKNAGTNEALESIDLIQEQVDYINKIVSDLQDFARPLKPEYTIVDLSDLVVSVFNTINLPDKITLKVDVKGSMQLKTDATFIKRSITNLVNNAIQAMPDGGALELTVTTLNEHMVITVSDTGKGIPEAVKPNLFKPLMTTKAKGQGLGLAVVKRLVEALNGIVSFESEEGKGTKFIIELPSINIKEQNGLF